MGAEEAGAEKKAKHVQKWQEMVASREGDGEGSLTSSTYALQEKFRAGKAGRRSRRIAWGADSWRLTIRDLLGSLPKLR